MVINWRDRYDHTLGTVKAYAATYSAGTDGTDELTLLTPDNVEKGHRLVWVDDNDRIQGLVHEMIVSSSRTVHDKRGKALHEVKAINSIAELYWSEVRKQSGIYVPHYTGQYDSEGNPIQNGYMLEDLMDAILTGTRWHYVAGGTYDIGGEIEYVGMRETYDVSVREIIAAAVAGFSGAELRTYVIADDAGNITDRFVSIAYPLAGSSVDDIDVKGRVVYSKNAVGITRDVGDSECYTAVRVIGADITDPDTHEVTGRHEVYLETQNTDQLNAWGKPMPDGTVGHSVYTVTTSEESDAVLGELAAQTLEDVVTPDVTYTVDVADLRGIRLREYVDVIDETFPTTLRMRARVTSIRQDLLNEARGGTITVGKAMNYAAVAVSYQSQNAVTASRVTDSAKSNRVTSSGRSGDSTTARVSTTERQIADLNERIDSSGGGGLSWPLIAKKGWWAQDDSFAFFDKTGDFGLTGKGDHIGVYTTLDGLTPDPQNQQWGEGSEVWRSLYTTDARTNLGAAFLRGINIASGKFRFTDSPATSHIFTKLLDAGVKVTNGLRALGFFYTGHSTTSSSTTTDIPFLTIEPRSGQRSGFNIKTPTPQGASNGFINGLLSVLEAQVSSTAVYLILKLPAIYNATSGSQRSRVELEFSSSDISGSQGTAAVDLSLHGQDSTGTGQAHMYANAQGSYARWKFEVDRSAGSSYSRGLKIDRTGIYAFDGSNETALHTF